MQGLKAIKSIAENKDKSPTMVYYFYLIARIMRLSPMVVIFLRPITRLMPIFMLMTNGMILGYLLDSLGNAWKAIMAIVLKGILPHGIIEIPVILLPVHTD